MAQATSGSVKSGSDRRRTRSAVTRHVERLLPDECDVLLIVPPFAGVSTPPLAPSLLQAVGKAAGFRVGLFYANLSFARFIGPRTYEAIARLCNRSLLGERIFAAAAYDLPPLGRRVDRVRARFPALRKNLGVRLSWPVFERSATGAVEWADSISEALASVRTSIFGCTTMFEQTSASVALLRRIKRRRSEVVAIIGGANCEEEMALGVASLSSDIDYVFSSESDSSFPEFIREVLSGRRPRDPIIRGGQVFELDELATPSFADYFAQLHALIPRSRRTNELRDSVRLPFETSRGCWWGQKHHCTFCGLNGSGMTYREKSPGRVILQLRQLAGEIESEFAPAERIRLQMTDNIMPRRYMYTLLPRLKTELPNINIYYEQKANLSLQDVVALKKSGIDSIQPGIETLSTSYATRMRKGVTAYQNVALLRYALAAGLKLDWNLLVQLPGERREELEQMIALVPLLRHLPPPTGVGRLSIDRFSPFFDDPRSHGLAKLRPLRAYADVFPAKTQLKKLAYFFEADYECASYNHPELIASLTREVDSWRKAWRRKNGAPPMMKIQRSPRQPGGAFSKEFVLLDTRRVPGAASMRLLDRDQARLLLVRRHLDESAEIDWAVERKLGIELDGYFVPLATTDVDLLATFERDEKPPSPSRRRIDPELSTSADLEA